MVAEYSHWSHGYLLPSLLPLFIFKLTAVVAEGIEPVNVYLLTGSIITCARYLD